MSDKPTDLKGLWLSIALIAAMMFGGPVMLMVVMGA